MSFEQGISGLNAASKSLEVIGNNIANANTIGAKSSRAEFSELFANSVSAAASKDAGTGVDVAAVAQQFTQGNITSTGNNLDLAINGNGFFQTTSADGSTGYTRAGQFKLNNQGFIVDNSGDKLMGYPTDVKGNRLSSMPTPLTLPTNTPIAPQATGNVTAQFNLDAATPTATATTPITAIGTSLNVYDGQGIQIPLSVYFTKTATANTWDVYTSVSGAAPTKQGGLSFNPDGSLKETLDIAGVATGKTTLPLSITTTSGASSPFASNIDFANSTQLGASFNVSQLTQDGYAPGQLNGVKVSATGILQASYSNGQSQSLGQITLANFRNAQGLAQTGAGQWSETAASGPPTRGAPGDGNLGAIQAGSLEESNVDLTSELVNMMTAQRSYQANAQTIKTMDQVVQTLMNMH
jgi:flagellar hook protein FlgE